MRDKKYFNSQIFAFVNEDVKNGIQKLAKKEDIPFYHYVDKVLKNYLRNKGMKIKQDPKILKLV